jgi:hypothetical protein
LIICYGCDIIKLRIKAGGFKQGRKHMDKIHIKPLFCFILALGLSVVVHGQEKAGQVSLGLGPEINMDTRKGTAYGAGLYVDYALSAAWALGVMAAASYDFDDIISIEPEAFIRWYLPLGWKIYPYIQADLGAVFIREGTRMVPTVLGGLSGGLRFPLRHFLIEPYGAFGFPFFWRAGLAVGFRFNI